VSAGKEKTVEERGKKKGRGGGKASRTWAEKKGRRKPEQGTRSNTEWERVANCFREGGTLSGGKGKRDAEMHEKGPGDTLNDCAVGGENVHLLYVLQKKSVVQGKENKPEERERLRKKRGTRMKGAKTTKESG